MPLLAGSATTFAVGLWCDCTPSQWLLGAAQAKLSDP